MRGDRQKQANNPTEGSSDFCRSASAKKKDIKKDINELKSLIFCFKDEIQNEIRNSLTEVRTKITALDNKVQKFEQVQDSVQESSSTMEILIQDHETQVRDLQDAHEDLETAPDGITSNFGICPKQYISTLFSLNFSKL